MLKLFGGMVVGSGLAYLYFKQNHKRLDEVDGHLKGIESQLSEFLRSNGWHQEETDEKVAELVAKPQ